MSMLLDLRFALRTLRKNLGVTLLAVTSLSLAIAGNTTVYSLINSFINRPLPYDQVERLVLIGERANDVFAGQLATTSPGNYLDFAERERSFDQTAAFQGSVYSLDTGSEEAEQLTTGAVTPGFFRLLGSQPAWGRTFAEEEGVRGRDRVVMLSHGFWQDRFGGREDLRDETLTLNGEPYDVVGVLPEDFEWLLAPTTEVWVPLALEAGTAPRNRRTIFALGRLAPGTSEQVAQADMDRIMKQLADEYPEANRGFVVELLNMRHDIPDARNKMFMTLMQVALIFVLLIACANIANLLLARSQAREREIAVRTSIGARRSRIVVQLLTESMVMALIAGTIGIGLGFLGTRAIGNAFAGLLPSFWVPTLDLRVLGYTLAVTLLGGVAFGLAPVLQTARFDLLPALKDGTQGASAGSRRRLASNTLVVVEIGAALAFLAGASMMINTFQTMQTAEAGFDSDRMLTMRVDLPDVRYDTDEKQAAGVRDVVEELGSLPGVTAVAISGALPRTPFVPDEAYEIDGQALAPDDVAPRVGRLTIGPDYFDALGMRPLQGRAFAPRDDLSAPRVAVINESMAERYWTVQDAVGRSFTIQGERHEIVGVVPTVRHDLFVRNEPSPLVYLAWLQQPAGAFAVSIKTAGEPSALAEPARNTLRDIDRTIAVTQVQTLDAFVEQFWVGQRIFTAILTGFGALALVLAALGTYGVLAYSVAQRTHEIGIRMAIGAGRAAVMRMIVSRGLLLGAIGVALGIPLVLLQVRVISAVFEGFVPVEPTSVFGVAALLGFVTFLASALPAHRAASVDPMRALRSE